MGFNASLNNIDLINFIKFCMGNNNQRLTLNYAIMYKPLKQILYLDAAMYTVGILLHWGSNKIISIGDGIYCQLRIDMP